MIDFLTPTKHTGVDYETWDTLSSLKDKCSLVYFFYSDSGTLLYIGKTTNFKTRWNMHVNSKDCITDVSRVDLHIFHSESEALFYESNNIISKKPLWNKMGTYGAVSKFDIQPIKTLELVTTKSFRFVLPLIRKLPPNMSYSYHEMDKSGIYHLHIIFKNGNMKDHRIMNILVSHDCTSVRTSSSKRRSGKYIEGFEELEHYAHIKYNETFKGLYDKIKELS